METIAVVQGHVVTFRPAREGPRRPELTSPVVGGKRGRVVGFSQASRRRMQRTLFRLGPADALFVTLTQRDSSYTMSQYQAHWRAMDARIRRAYPAVGAIFWRVERQQRGALHLHLIIIAKAGCRLWIPWQWFAVSWGRIVGQIGEKNSWSSRKRLRKRKGKRKIAGQAGEKDSWSGWPSVKVKRASRYDNVKYWRYVSKYVSKGGGNNSGNDSGAAASANGESAQQHATLVERVQAVSEGRQLAAPDACLEDNCINARFDDDTGRSWGVTGRQYLVFASFRLLSDVVLTAESKQWIEKMAAWRAQQGFSLLSWSLVLWQRLTS